MRQQLQVLRLVMTMIAEVCFPISKEETLVLPPCAGQPRSAMEYMYSDITFPYLKCYVYAC